MISDHFRSIVTKRMIPPSPLPKKSEESSDDGTFISKQHTEHPHIFSAAAIIAKVKKINPYIRTLPSSLMVADNG